MLTERGMQALAELDWQLIRLPLPVNGDRLTDVVDHDLARVASGEVLLKLVANGRIDRAINVFTQLLQQLFAFHTTRYILTHKESEIGKKLHLNFVPGDEIREWTGPLGERFGGARRHPHSGLGYLLAINSLPPHAGLRVTYNYRNETS